MAQLTWRNVDAPSGAGVTDAYRLMAAALNNGFSTLTDAVDGFQKSRTDANSSAAAIDLLKNTTPEQMDAYLAGGGLGRFGTVNKDTIDLLAGRTKDLLFNRGLGLQNADRAEALSQTQWANANTRAYEAARPEALKAATEIRSYAEKGTPQDLEKARQLQQQYMPIFAKAGWSVDDALKMAAGNTAAADTGVQLTDTFIKANDARTARDERLAADEVVARLAQVGGDQNNAVRILQQAVGQGFNPKVAALAYDQIAGDTGGKLFGQPTDATSLLVDQELRRAGALGTNPLMNLIDRTEGGGRFDTLYGHAQKPGGAFAGVDVSKATIGQLKQFASADGAYGQHQKQQLGYLATPMGRFQIVGSTLAAAAKEMGLPDNTVFDENTQMAIFNHLVDKRLSGPRTLEGKMAGLRQEWAGFKNVPDKELAAAISAYENGDKGALTGFVQGGSQGGGNLADQYASTDSTDLINATTDLGTRSNTLLDIMNADSAFNPLEPMVMELMDRPHRGEQAADTAARIHKEIGDDMEGGILGSSGLTAPILTEEIQRIARDWHVAPDFAGTLLKNGLVRNANWFAPDSRQIDAKQVDRYLGEFIDRSGKIKGDKLQGSVEQMQAMRFKTQAAETIKQLGGQVQQAHQEFVNAQMRAMAGAPVDVKAAEMRLKTLQKLFAAKLEALDKNPLLRSNSARQSGK